MIDDSAFSPVTVVVTYADGVHRWPTTRCIAESLLEQLNESPPEGYAGGYIEAAPAVRHHPGGHDHDQTTHGSWAEGTASGVLSESEQQALGRWARTSGPIQATATGAQVDPASVDDVELLDAAIGRSRLAADTVLTRGLAAPMDWDGSLPMSEVDPATGVLWETKGGYRGTGLFAGATGSTRDEAFDNIGPSLVGREFFHPGYLATSRNGPPPPEFDNAVHRVVLRIKAPAGTPALNIDRFSPHGERETLVARGRTLRVTDAAKVTKRDSWTGRDYEAWEIDMEIVNP